MRKLFYALPLLLAVMFIASCNDTETYAEQKEKERDAINRYIVDSAVTVISEAKFKEQDYTTDLSKNEFVLFESNGVYLQIIRKGSGEKIKKGETTTVLCRFTERNIITDSLQLSNNIPYMASIVDKMIVTRNSDSYTASFISGQSWLCQAYGNGTTSVPSGWLAPLPYINIGRSESGNDIAKVRIIVPHTQGHAYASSSVYPCLYDLTYQRGR